MSAAAASRLRKAFRYPSEDDAVLSDSGDMDEEHQEQLITALAAADAASTALYRKLSLAIPLLGAAYFLLAIVTSSTARGRLTALLSASSLLCTAYVLHFLPVEAPGKGKKPLYKVEAEKGPLERYLMPLNGALVVLLQIAAVAGTARGAALWRESLPLGVFALIMVVRAQLKPLDLEELQRARYELKGA